MALMYGGPIGSLHTSGGTVTGILSLPIQPNFSTSLASPQVDVTGGGATATVICNTIIHDTGNGYNNITGVYTIPNSGYYCFNTTVALLGVGAVNNGGHAWYLVNSTVHTIYRLDVGAARYAADTTFTGSGSLALPLNAGDTVKVQILVLGDGQTIDIDTPTIFSGYMVA